MPTSSQYISTSRAAEHLGLSREHVRRLIQQGELHAEETVNGFMLDMREIERFAATRQVQRDQHEFRLAVNDLAAKLRHVEGATTLGSVVASLRDEAKLRSAFELSDAVAAQMEWMNQQVAAEPALAVLQELVKAVTDQWHRMADHADHALKMTRDHDNYAKATIAFEANVLTQDSLDRQNGLHITQNSLDQQNGLRIAQNLLNRQQASIKTMQGNIVTTWKQQGEHIANLTRDMGSQADPLGMGMAEVARKYPEEAQKSDWQPRKEDVTTASKLLASSAAPNEEMARGFVVTEPREGRLEEKVDELDRKVEKLTELVMQQRADTAAEMPTWQQWAGSDRPEDVLAKLATIREAITGGKQAGENSTDVIRAAREARGRGE